MVNLCLMFPYSSINVVYVVIMAICESLFIIQLAHKPESCIIGVIRLANEKRNGKYAELLVTFGANARSAALTEV